MLPFSECLVCVCMCVCVCVCVLFIYTISISITCVLQEEPSFLASNQQIWLFQVNNFGTEKTLWKVNFSIFKFFSELFIQYSKDSCCEHITIVVNIYLFGYVTLLATECTVRVCVCDIKSEYLQKTMSCVRSH